MQDQQVAERALVVIPRAKLSDAHRLHDQFAKQRGDVEHGAPRRRLGQARAARRACAWKPLQACESGGRFAPESKAQSAAESARRSGPRIPPWRRRIA